jgi:rubrerythrin
MERAAAVSEFNRLMKGNKKADLAQMVLNEERVANMWRDTAQMNDERIHQLEQENLRLQQDLDEVREALALSGKQTYEYMQYWETSKAVVKAGRELLEKYHTGVLLHTDGTLSGTTFMIDGKIPHKMATVRVKANLKVGVQASYETMEAFKAERHWIFGEMSPLNLAYDKRRQTHKEYREDRVRAMILEAAAANNRKAPKMPKKLPEINKWECSHCWAPNYLNDTIFKKDRMKCGVCNQWTEAGEVKA